MKQVCWHSRRSKAYRFFFGRRHLPFGWSPTLRLTCGPAGNRTTTGSLSAMSKNTALPTSPQGRLLQGLPRPARGTRTKRGSRGLESIQYYCWGPLAMIDGVAVGHCGAFWTCKSIAVCQSCASFGKKRPLQNFIVGAVKHWLGLQEVVLPSCVEKLMVKQFPTLIHLHHAETFLCESW